MCSCVGESGPIDPSPMGCGLPAMYVVQFKPRPSTLDLTLACRQKKSKLSSETYVKELALQSLNRPHGLEVSEYGFLYGSKKDQIWAFMGSNRVNMDFYGLKRIL